jgi:hypothetical protein
MDAPQRCDAVSSDGQLSSDLGILSRAALQRKQAGWPAPGSADTELGVFMGPEVSHGETKIYAGVQA